MSRFQTSTNVSVSIGSWYGSGDTPHDALAEATEQALSRMVDKTTFEADAAVREQQLGRLQAEVVHLRTVLMNALSMLTNEELSKLASTAVTADALARLQEAGVA